MAGVRHIQPVLAGLALAIALCFTLPPVTGAPTLPVAPDPIVITTYAAAWPAATTSVTPLATGSVTTRVFRSESGAETVTATGPGRLSMSGRHYAFLSLWGHQPARWNPCAPIRWKVNFLGNRLTTELPRLTAAFAAMSRATGIRFGYAGRTTAAVGRAAPGADIVVWFATRRQGATMYGARATANLLGVGGHTDWPLGGTVGGPLVPQRGDAAFVATKIAALTGRERMNLYLHELGHVMNLGHVLDASQVMNPTTSTRSPGTFGVGDRNGLALLGRVQGCVAVPVRPSRPTFTLTDDALVISVPRVSSPSGPVTYTLRDAVLHHVISTSSTPTFTIARSVLLAHPALRDAAFEVVAQNWVGQSAGTSRTFEVDAVDLVAVPTIAATGTRISIGAASLRICGTSVPTTEGLVVTGGITVTVYQGTVPTGTTFALGGPGSAMSLSGFHDVRFHLSGSLSYRVSGTGSQTVDYTGVVITAL
jgi:hypothetical protein